MLILPDCSQLDSIFSDSTVSKIKRWVEDGGTLIAVGGSAGYVAQAKHGLSSVRLKRDVLDELSVYAEAIQREKAGRAVKVDFDDVWGRKSACSDNQEECKGGKDDEKSVKKSDGKKEIGRLKRDDKWQRLFSPGMGSSPPMPW